MWLWAASGQIFYPSGDYSAALPKVAKPALGDAGAELGHSQGGWAAMPDASWDGTRRNYMRRCSRSSVSPK